MAPTGPSLGIPDILAFDAAAPSTVYAGSQTGVFKSVDWGVTMTKTNWGLAPVTGVVVSPSDSNTIFVGTTSGLYRTQDGGATWSQLNLAGASGFPNTIAVSPSDSKVVLVGLSRELASGGGVLKSTDGGVTFHLSNSGLSGGPMNLYTSFSTAMVSLRFSPDGTVALATGGGIYISTDSGDHWQNANANAIPTYFSDVAWDRGYLYAATQGQGVLRTEMPGNVHVTITSSTSGAPFSLEDRSTYSAPVTFSWAPGVQHTVTWLRAPAVQSGARYSFQGWTDGGSNPRTITVPPAAATYTATIQAQYQLTITVSPAAEGSVGTSPASADGYFASGTNVTVTAAAASGYAFGYFSGDVAGGASPQTVAMTAPRAVTANFYPAPPPGALPGVLAYWPADNSALDVVSGVTGTLVNGATFAAGKVNQAFSLNGVSSYVHASQCSISATGSSAIVNGNTLTLTLNITFKSALQGNRVIWVAGRDSAGANNTDWQAMATWAVQQVAERHWRLSLRIGPGGFAILSEEAPPLVALDPAGRKVEAPNALFPIQVR